MSKTNDRHRTETLSIAHQRKLSDQHRDDDRARSDDRYAKSRSRSEKTSSRSVAKGRKESDVALAKSRREADSALRTELHGPKQSLSAERRSAASRLRAERAAADRFSRTERLATDAAYGKEREDLGRSRREQLTSERAAHDKSLARERRTVDKSTRRAEAFLTRELADHLHTRDALALRDEFLRLLSQDLKRPMTTIAVAADRLRNKAYHIGADAEDREKVEIIARSSQEVLRLIGDLLERVALWQESPRERRRNPKGRGSSRADKGARKG
jgi:signal transduction histidine kinase